MFPEQEPIYVYTHQLRSRYGETDQMGYVYYGRYLEYFEEARTEMIRSLGLPYAELEKKGVMLPVIHTEVDYKAPIFYDELMSIEVLLFEIPKVRLETYYRVYTDRKEAFHVQGKVELCFMKEDTRKPCRAPTNFTDGLKKVMKA
ncbi:thioesterase family protein [Fodinibius sp. Rm-B-1B1-1]|uniref:acyl-CoA thioesterase n=1 Tax=Fodinibius alkaliphilus TaxID=3140241 RepID=UPI00315A0A47